MIWNILLLNSFVLIFCLIQFSVAESWNLQIKKLKIPKNSFVFLKMFFLIKYWKIKILKNQIHLNSIFDCMRLKYWHDHTYFPQIPSFMKLLLSYIQEKF